jgi:hypothetical protein
LAITSPTGTEIPSNRRDLGGGRPTALPTQMRSPGLPAAATLAVVSLLVLLPTQIRVRNVAILSLLIYAALASLTCVVNTLVWAGNVRDVAPIWCDICESPSGSADTCVLLIDEHRSDEHLVLHPVCSGWRGIVHLYPARTDHIIPNRCQTSMSPVLFRDCCLLRVSDRIHPNS